VELNLNELENQKWQFAFSVIWLCYCIVRNITDANKNRST
jgi:hypothetical protein